MSVVDIEKTYTSPRHKLLQFFEQSRNRWKRKCLDAKKVVKRLKNRACAIQRSRDLWKGLARQQREELKLLRRELGQRELKID